MTTTYENKITECQVCMSEFIISLDNKDRIKSELKELYCKLKNADEDDFDDIYKEFEEYNCKIICNCSNLNNLNANTGFSNFKCIKCKKHRPYICSGKNCNYTVCMTCWGEITKINRDSPLIYKCPVCRTNNAKNFMKSIILTQLQRKVLGDEWYSNQIRSSIKKMIL